MAEKEDDLKEIKERIKNLVEGLETQMKDLDIITDLAESSGIDIDELWIAGIEKRVAACEEINVRLLRKFNI